MFQNALENKVALVTGAESGIGAACARACAEAGAHVGILYFRDRGAAEETKSAVEKIGRKAAMAACDVTIESDVEAAFDAVVSMLGRVDVLVNSAGINMSGVEVADMTLTAWRRMLDTDATGSFLTSRRFVRDARRAKRGGAIVN